MMINVSILIWKKWGHKEPIHKWFFEEPLKGFLVVPEKVLYGTKKNTGSLKNLSQIGSSGNQKMVPLWHHLTAKPPFWFLPGTFFLH